MPYVGYLDVKSQNNSHKMSLLVAVVLLLGSAAARTPDSDHCSVDTWSAAGRADVAEKLTFSKELSTTEYVVAGGEKSLHCCARGYRSIEWFKDGRPYPWPGDVSNFILYPEAANQTIYSPVTGSSEGGNYSCIIRNDSHVFSHSVGLNVIDSANYMGAPLPTYELPDEQVVELGTTTRLFCEAFVGSTDLPDAQSEIVWRRVGRNATFMEEQRRFTLRSVARENNQVLGAYLIIHGVEREDLGLYECRVANAGDQAIILNMWLREAEISDETAYSPRVWRRLAWVSISLLLLAITVTGLRHRLGILALLCRNRMVQPDVHDGKDYDVLVAYLERDEQYASEFLSTLKDRYYYSCNSYQILHTPDVDCASELKEVSRRCRRLIVLIRPSMVEALSASALPVLNGPDEEDRWQSDVLAALLQQLIRIHPQPVCVALQALPRSAGENNLACLMRIAPVIEWHQKKSLWFKNWSLLRLRLPPLRAKQPTPASSMAIARSEGVITTVVSSACGASGSMSKRRSAPFMEHSLHDSMEILV